MDVFAEVKAIVRAAPNSFQETLKFIEGQILRGKEPPSPAAIQKAFLELWRYARGNTLILIAWLLSDTEIGQGGPAVNPVLADVILDHFEGDDSADPLTLQEWIMGYIFWPDRSEKRLKNAIDAYKPAGKTEGQNTCLRVPGDLITLTVAITRYQVSKATLKRAIEDGRIISYRPPNAATNSPHKVSESDISNAWPAWK